MLTVPASGNRFSAPLSALCAAITLSLPGLALAADAAPQSPMALLSAMLQDEKKALPTLMAVQSVVDANTAPLLEAAMRSSVANRRLFAVSAIGSLLNKQAAPLLIERVNSDTDMTVRAEALARLISLESATPEVLTAALAIADERVQCLAARALAIKGSSPAAVAMLEKLTSSKEKATECLARACLLGLGRKEQLDPLRAVVRDPKSNPAVLGLVLRQFDEQKTESAMALVLEIAGNEDYSLPLRGQAYATMAKMSSVAAVTLRDAIAASKLTVFRVQLMKLLAEQAGCEEHLCPLAKDEGPIGPLARFELARKAGGAGLPAAAGEALSIGHPVAIAYVLDRIGEDTKSNAKIADLYIAPLCEFIRGVDPRPTEMKKEHFFAAGAAARMLEINSPKAVAALKDLLAGKATAVTRSVAAGMLRSSNPAAAELMLPLLNSAYPELATDAALALAHLGRAESRPALVEIVNNPQQNAPALQVLSAWYLLKLDGKHKAAAVELAKLVK